MAELATYTFFSHLRRGLARVVKAPDQAGPSTSARVAFDVAVELDGDPGKEAKSRLELYGPGDVTGVEPGAVIRTDPADGAVDFEPNYFPAVEFDAPDFAWRFTPAAPDAQGRLRPWIALVVLKESEFEPLATRPDPLPGIRVFDAGRSLPPPEQLWAWAHVQVSARVSGGDEVRARMEGAREQVISRVLCPRRLEPLTSYRAFLVPTLEAGRLAGLGEDPGDDSLSPAWPRTETAVELPVYFRFSFRTSERGDFEELVRRLEPRTIDPRVGTRDMHVVDQPFDVPDLDRPVGLAGALKPLVQDPRDEPDTTAFQERMTRVLSAATDLLEGVSGAERVVAPPLYGRWPAARERVEPGVPPWFAKLNAEPVGRAGGGLGALVVRERQEELMAAAWQQIGRIEEANDELRRAQMGREAAMALWRRDLVGLPPARTLSITSLVHGRVLGSPTSIRHQLAQSPVPLASLTGTSRRIHRARSSLARRQGRRGTAEPVARLNAGELAAAGAPPEQPEGTHTVASVVGRVFRPPPAEDASPAGPDWILWALIAAALGLVGLAFGGSLSTPTTIAAIGGAILAAGAAFVRRNTGVEKGAENEAPSSTGGESGEATSGSDSESSSPGPDPEKPVAAARVESAPPRPGFQLTEPGTPLAASGEPTGGKDSEEAAAFRRAATLVQGRIGRTPLAVERPAPADLPLLASKLVAALDPEQAIRRRVSARVPPGQVDMADDEDPLDPIMAAPTYELPMFEPLRDLSTEFVLPGLQHVPPDTVGLLRTNQEFVEAYMVGLSHEMSRELLWRGFPSDQRATMFRQFWDVRGALRPDGADPEAFRESLRDIRPIHRWGSDSELGRNSVRDPSSVDGQLVLLIRGELLRRYPTAVIYAVKARFDPLRRVRDLDEEAGARLPVFRGTLPPDVTFLGFDLTAAEARGNADVEQDQGWFFVLQEQPFEPRFGLDAASGPIETAPAKLSDLSWGHMAADRGGFDALTHIDLDAAPPHFPWVFDGTGDPQTFWGRHGSDMAHITLQQPVRVAVHGSRLIP
jgi:hypothetical protein